MYTFLIDLFIKGGAGTTFVRPKDMDTYIRSHLPTIFNLLFFNV